MPYVKQGDIHRLVGALAVIESALSRGIRTVNSGLVETGMHDVMKSQASIRQTIIEIEAHAEQSRER